MICWPQIESVCHHDHDLRRVAEWLFDWLDRHPPSGIGDLTVYLCYHLNDQAAFLTAQRDEQLAAALLEIYQQEKEWDGRGFGDLAPSFPDFRKPAPEKEWDERGFRHLVFDLPATGRLELRWQPTETEIPPGVIGIARRATIPLGREEPILAELRIEQGAEIARHLDRWQGEARWRQPVVYLPHEPTTLLIGATAGCDLYAPSLSDGVALTYNKNNDEWSWEWPLAPWLEGGRSPADLDLKLNVADSSRAIRLLGGRLPQPRTLGQLEAANRLEPSVLEIIGCALPRAPYGVVPADTPPQIASVSDSAVRLPGNGWLYFDTRAHAPCFAHPGQPAGYRLIFGQPAGPDRWEKPSEPEYFHGELIFKTPPIAELALGAISGNVPDDIFINHRDVLLGKPPLKLVSPDGRNYELVFNPHARHPVFKGAKRHDPSAPGSIMLDAQDRFILGTTIYRLRRKKTEPYQSPLIESAKGKVL